MKHNKWRRPSMRGRARWWLMHRLLPLVLIVLTGGALLYAVFEPFFHPRIHLLYAEAVYPDGLVPNHVSPLEDVAGFPLEQFQLVNELSRSDPVGRGEIASPAVLDGILSQLDQREMRDRDVLVIWLRAQWMQHAGELYLLCGNLDPSDPQTALYGLDVVLERISRCPAGAKVILLDGGQISHDPRLGLFAGCSPHRIRQVVEAVDDPSLWVLLSHGELQRSHAIQETRSSAFAFFVGEGLAGEADEDEDGLVDLGEMNRYLASQMTPWVADRSPGRMGQLPVLLCGRAGRAASGPYPLLAPVPPMSLEDLSASEEDGASGDGGLTAAQRRRAKRRLVMLSGSSGGGVQTALARVPGQQSGQDTGGDPAARTAGAEDNGGDSSANGAAGQAAGADGERTNGDSGAQGGREVSDAGENDAGPDGDSPSTDEPAAGRPQGAPGDDGSAADERVAGIRTLRGPPLMTLAWSLYGDLFTAPDLVPARDAPHLYRALQYRLRNLETAFRSSDDAFSVDPTPKLRQLSMQMNDLLASRTPFAYQPRDLPVHLAAASQEAEVESHSLAMAHRLTGPAGANVEQVRRQLRSLASEGRREDFQQWVAELPEQYDRYQECLLARALSAREDLAWPAIQLALTASLAAEDAASQTLSVGDWTRSQIVAADRARLAGLRRLMSAVHPEDAANATALLRRAVSEYQSVAEWNEDVLQLELMVDEALVSLPGYLRWSIVAIQDRAAPDPDELAQLVRQLDQALRLLDNPAPNLLPDVHRVRLQLGVALQPLRRRFAQATLASEATNASDPTNPGSDGRFPTSESGRTFAAALGFDALCTPVLTDAVVSDSASSQPTEPEQRRRLRQLAGLYGKAVRALLGDASAEQWKAQEVVEAASQCAESTDDSIDLLWQSCEQLGTRLQDFISRLPDRLNQASTDCRDLTDTAARPAKVRQLRIARRLLYLVHPWDAVDVLSTSPATLLRRAELYDLLVWQRRRVSLAQNDALSWQLPFLVAAEAAYAEAAGRVALQPPLDPLDRPLLDLRQRAPLQLTDTPEQDLPLEVVNRREIPVDVWLVYDFDPDQLVVSAPNNEVMYDTQGRTLSSTRGRLPTPPVRRAAAAGGVTAPVPRQPESYPDRPDLTTLEPTFRLRPGEQRPVWIHVRRSPGGAAETRVVVRALTRHDFVRLDLTASLPWQPVIDLAVAGVADTWQQTERGLTLYPFPNRVTPYTLSLTNTASEERQVDVEILRATKIRDAETPPVGEVGADEADEFLSLVGPLETVAAARQVSVPPGDRDVPIPFGRTAGPTSAEAPEEPAAKPAPKPDQPPPALDRLLLAVITDRDTNQKTIRSLEILTQRPARYVSPLVEYDPSLRRAEIVIRALNSDALPPGGVSIECEQADGRGPARPQALLQPPATETRLQMEVLPNGMSPVPIVLHVDGYQRAFRFALPVDAGSRTDVPRLDDAAVRILAPEAGAAFGPEPEPIPVALQVDVSDELMQNTEGLLEIGLDANRDRRLIADQTLVLSSDRQVDLSLAESDSSGTFAIQTRVADLDVTLPAPKLRAARGNLLARLRLPTGDEWSEPIEVVFDDQPPRISQLALEPGASVIQGETLEVSCLASDQDLSGVAQVEAGFDLERRGEAPAKPVSGTIQSSGRWRVSLPAEPDPGVYNVMIRAIDRQGNASDYQKLRVQILSPEEAESVMDEGRRVSGTVVYGRFGKEPLGGVAVQLADAAGTSSRQTVTDDQGRFVFDDVRPGEYRVVAQALVRGNPRSGSAEIQVRAKPAAVEPVELILTIGR